MNADLNLARLVKQVGDVAIYDVIGSQDHERIEALLSIYAHLFPQYAHYTPRMRRRVYKPSENAEGHVVHYWLVEVDGQPAGIRTFRYNPKRRCGIAHALAIGPDYRATSVKGLQLSQFIINSCLHQITNDAIIRGLPKPCGMVNEVQYLSLMKHYETMGIQRLNIDYREPVFPETDSGAVQFHPMHLAILPDPDAGCDLTDKAVIADFALAYLVDHYGLLEDNQDVQTILTSINNSSRDYQ